MDGWKPVLRSFAAAIAIVAFTLAVTPRGAAQTEGPAILLEKTTNGVDADAAPGPVIVVTDPVTWSFHAVNIGSVALTNVTITDDQLGLICTGIYLAPDATATCERSGSVVLGQHVNVGSVVGTPLDGSANVSDTDPSYYFGVADPTNDAPVVDAGPDQTVTLPAVANLTGSADDDGLPDPPGALTHAWSVVSGPGDVVFGDPTSPSTTAAFDTAGTFVLRFAASDGVLTASDDVTVEVSGVLDTPVLIACPTEPTPFVDTVGSFADDEIRCVFGLGIALGTTATTFDPLADVTRQQMAAFLARLWRGRTGDCPVASAVPIDVAGSFAEADIACLYGLGVAEGTDPITFDPLESVSRQQMAAFLARLWRVMGGGCPTDPTPLIDIAESFAEADIVCIYGLGISTGTGPDTFAPQGDVSRQQMAAFLARFWREANNRLLFPPS